MRTLIVALAITLISASAHAQNGAGLGGVPESSSDQSGTKAAQAAARKKERAESEQAYKKALGAIPDAKKPYDPWGTVRP